MTASPSLLVSVVLAAGFALAACAPDPTPPPPQAPPASPAVQPDDSVVAPAPAAPFDGSAVVFEEPPEAVVEIPPRPSPPSPRPSAPPPPPAPEPTGPSGSCDVRPTEGYCFAFSGEAWTPSAARAQCAAAPDAAYAPTTCPLADRVATCTFERPSQPGREITYTYYAPYDPRLAELACPGRFSRIE